MKLKSTLKGFDSLDRILKSESKRQDKALQLAIRVEGFRLMRLLKEQVKKGSPGGRRFKKLSYLSRAWGGKGRLRPDRPLSRLAVAIRYQIRNDPYSMQIGWVGPRVSKSWKRIAEKQQEGFDSPVSEARRAYFAGKGGRMGKRSVAKRFMFLRKGTKNFKTPARPILDPFWKEQRHQAILNIRKNHLTALRGKVIRSGYTKTVRRIKAGN